MINPKMEAALNKQINEEFYSSYLYLSMSAYFESVNLAGFANWMKVQSQEEYFHATKFYNYVIQKGGKVTLEAIAKPKIVWSSTIEAFEDTYAHEQKISALINGLVDLALELKDHATNSFLQWFVTEQVEEEANDVKILEDLKAVGDNRSVLFMIDREMSTRVFTPPATPAT